MMTSSSSGSERRVVWSREVSCLRTTGAGGTEVNIWRHFTGAGTCNTIDILVTGEDYEEGGDNDEKQHETLVSPD